GTINRVSIPIELLPVHDHTAPSGDLGTPCATRKPWLNDATKTGAFEHAELQRPAGASSRMQNLVPHYPRTGEFRMDQWHPGHPLGGLAVPRSGPLAGVQHGNPLRRLSGRTGEQLAERGRVRLQVLVRGGPGAAQLQVVRPWWSGDLPESGGGGQ